MKYEDLSREHKVVLFCLGHLKELVEKGFLSQGSMVLSKSGEKLFKQISKENFRPTMEEMKIAIGSINEGCRKS